MIGCGNTDPTVLVQVNAVNQSGNFYIALLLRVVIKGEKIPTYEQLAIRVKL
jgi:hypothetical protein